MKVKLIVDGGKMQPGPVVAQQLGPLGINLGKVITDVNDATKGFSGMKVPVEIDVNTKTKAIKINVFSPPVAELIKKEVSIEKGSGQPNTFKVGNIAFERLIWIAKTKTDDLLAKNLKSAVKLIVGSCVSLGVLVDNKEAKEIEKDIDAGKYDKEISNEISEVSAEKKSELDKFFADRKARQERDIKAAEEAKAAAEAAAVAAKAAEGAAPAAGAKVEAAAEAGKKPAAAGKKEEVKKEEAKKPEAKKAEAKKK